MTPRRQTASPLHLEWTPTWVRAVNTATGETAQAATVADLGAITHGHAQALVGVGHSHVFVRTLRLPKAAPADLRHILAIQTVQLFPLPPAELSFDFFQTADQTAEGWLTVVAAIRSEDILRIREELRAVSLTATRILPVALAAPAVASRALGNTPPAPDLSGEPALSGNGALVVQNSPTGLSLDIVQSGILRLSRVVAPGSDPAAEAQRTLAAARVGSLPVIVAASDTVKIPGAAQTPVSEISLLQETPRFDFELAEDRIREAKQRIHRLTNQAILCALAALTLVLYVWTQRSDAQAQVTQSAGKWKQRIIKQTAIESDESTKAVTLTGVGQSLTQAFQPGQPLSDINSVVSDSLPAGAWLNGVTLERGKVADVRGTASNAAVVTRLVDTLGENARFRDVRLVYANSATIQTQPVVQFDVTMICTGNLPMPVPQTTKTTKSGATSSGSSSTTITATDSDANSTSGGGS